MSHLEHLIRSAQCRECLDSVEKLAFEARATAAVDLGARS
jgi:hypothetical protein